MAQVARKFIKDLAINNAKIDNATITQGKLNLAAPSAANDAATKSYVDTAVAGAGGTHGKQSITLSGTNITNQYVDLAQTIKANSLSFMADGLTFNEGVDYTVNLTGGSGGVTRVSFIGDLATGGNAALVATDVIYFKYVY